MKIHFIIAALIIGLSLSQALACGPGMTSSGNNVSSNNGGASQRQQWTKKRLRHLKQKMADDESARKTADRMDYLLGNNPQHSPAYMRQRMINRFEFLALKRERRGLSSNEMAEMQLLQRTLLGR